MLDNCTDRIVCVLKDQNGVITHFKLDNNKTYSKATIINAISIDSFYTYKCGIKATVLSRQYHITKRVLSENEPRCNN